MDDSSYGLLFDLDKNDEIYHCSSKADNRPLRPIVLCLFIHKCLNLVNASLKRGVCVRYWAFIKE